MLAKSPDKYTVGMILRLTEGSLAPVPCVEQETDVCDRSGACATQTVWRGLYDVVNDYLDSVTLKDIVDRQNDLYSNDYVI